MPIQSKKQPPYYNSLNPIKRFVGLITQTSTNDPTIKILQNTYINTPTSLYQGPGEYLLTNTAEFILNKTTVTISQTPPQSYITAVNDTNNTIFIQTLSSSGSNIDGLLDNNTIIIETYP